MPRVLITDNLSPAGLKYLKDARLDLDVRSGLKPPEVREALKSADGIIIRSGTTLTEERLKDQPRLKVIVRAGVGVDNIDLAAATREGIVVMNTPAGNTTSTASDLDSDSSSAKRKRGPMGATSSRPATIACTSIHGSLCHGSSDSQTLGRESRAVHSASRLVLP